MSVSNSAYFRASTLLAVLGLSVALTVSCTDDSTPADSVSETSNGDGDGDPAGDGDTAGDGDGDTTTTGDGDGDGDDETGPNCTLGTFGCECDAEGMCVEGLVCGLDNTCSFGDGSGDGDGDGDGDAPPNDPTVFDCVSTEPLTLGEFTGDPNTLLITAPINEVEVGGYFHLDFWGEGAGTFDLATDAQWGDQMCTHCVYLLSNGSSWWAAEGTVNIDTWVDFQMSAGSITGLVLQETDIDASVYNQPFIADPTCYTIEDITWDTIDMGGDGDGDMP